MDDETHHKVIRRQEASGTDLDALLLQRAQETASGYLPFGVLVCQYRDLFHEDLQLPAYKQPPRQGLRAS